MQQHLQHNVLSVLYSNKYALLSRTWVFQHLDDSIQFATTVVLVYII
jgi:hypothetical protein